MFGERTPCKKADWLPSSLRYRASRNCDTILQFSRVNRSVRQTDRRRDGRGATLNAISSYGGSHNNAELCRVYRTVKQTNGWRCRRSSLTWLDPTLNSCWCLPLYFSRHTYFIDDAASLTAARSFLPHSRHYQSSAHCRSYQPSRKIWLSFVSVQEINLEKLSHFVWDRSK